MASMIVRNPSEGIQPEALIPNVWDPFRKMREFLQWDPLLFNAPTFAEKSSYAFVPAFEVKETKDAYVFQADVPGIKEQDVEITLTGDRLTITGKRESLLQDKGDRFYTYERSYGSFTRTFTLPVGVSGDQAKAEMKEGVLTLVLPKRPEQQSKHIAIKTTEKARA